MNYKNNLFLYWKIGENVNSYIGENACRKYSDFISYKYGLTDTFSINNIKYMQKFNLVFPNYINEFNKLNWNHYKLLINVKRLEERDFYLKVAIFSKCSVEELDKLISNNVFNTIKKR